MDISEKPAQIEIWWDYWDGVWKGNFADSDGNVFARMIPHKSAQEVAEWLIENYSDEDINKNYGKGIQKAIRLVIGDDGPKPKTERNLEIWARVKAGERRADLAKEFGVCVGRIGQIKDKYDRLEHYRVLCASRDAELAAANQAAIAAERHAVLYSKGRVIDLQDPENPSFDWTAEMQEKES
jgi:hypothetical protein